MGKVFFSRGDFIVNSVSRTYEKYIYYFIFSTVVIYRVRPDTEYQNISNARYPVSGRILKMARYPANYRISDIKDQPDNRQNRISEQTLVIYDQKFFYKELQAFFIYHVNNILTAELTNC